MNKPAPCRWYRPIGDEASHLEHVAAILWLMAEEVKRDNDEAEEREMQRLHDKYKRSER